MQDPYLCWTSLPLCPRGFPDFEGYQRPALKETAQFQAFPAAVAFQCISHFDYYMSTLILTAPMHRLVTTACKDEQGLRLSRTLLLMHLPLGVFRMECLCIFGKNSKRRPFGSTEQHFFFWLNRSSLLAAR